MHFAHNPQVTFEGQAVSRFYPDMTEYLKTHSRPTNNEHGQWSFDMIFPDGHTKRPLYISDFNSAIRAVCRDAHNEGAIKLILIDNIFSQEI